MRIISIVRGYFSRFSLFCLARSAIMIMALIVLGYATPTPAAERIAVFPATPYDGYIIYESLAVFWLGIIGLLVILRMKLREIERIQEMGEDREDNDAPLLE
jgi:hypothetical protein